MNEANEKIMLSVCVVTYNHRKYIQQALDSILAQKTSFKVEIIVADDASNDGTAEYVAANYNGKIRLIQRKENVGLSKNLYDCMCAANGKYIYTHAGDDWIKKNHMFQEHVDFLEANMQYASISHWTDIISDKGVKIGVIQNFDSVYTLSDFLMGKHLDCQDSMIRNYWKEERDSNKFLYECGRNNEENALNLYVMEKGAKYIVQKSLACYRYVCNERKHNYNSTHALIDVFEDNYSSLLYLQKIRGEKYDFSFMKLKLIYEFIGGAVKRDHSIKEIILILKFLSSEDKKLLWQNLGKLIWYRGKFPEDYMKEKIFK